jgi:phosphonate transport system permease protein
MSLQFVVNKPRGPLGWWILVPIVGVSVAALWWSAVGTRLSLSDLIAGLPWIADFIGRMLPPNFAFMQKLIQPALETVQIALWGTLLGVVLALPVCFFAARNLSPYAWVFHGLRQVLNGINEIILALIFAAVGLGPRLDRARHGRRRRHRLRADQLDEAVRLRGHRGVRDRDPGARAGGRPGVVQAAGDDSLRAVEPLAIQG